MCYMTRHKIISFYTNDPIVFLYDRENDAKITDKWQKVFKKN